MARNDDLKFNNYAAAFIDLLGQRETLKDCGLLPDKLEEFLPVAKKSIGVIGQLHMSFQTFYEALQEEADGSLVSEEHKERFLRSQKTQLKFQRFSDGLVAFLSLAQDEGYVPITGVYSLIAASGSLCLLGLSIQQPLRGGIEIAWGAELNDNELYGCVVAKSYELESQIAKWPRIVLGPELVRYLDAHEQLPGDELEIQYIRSLAKCCKRMIVVSDDGFHMVDYLGPGFKEYVANSIDSSLFTEAASFVEGQLKHWEQMSDETLEERYRQLQSYFERNREIWVS